MSVWNLDLFPVAFRLGFFDYENNHPKEQQMN